MRAGLAALLVGLPFASLAQLTPQQVEIQRALIQRDQQSAEFAARGVEARRALENLNAGQLRDAGTALNPDPVIARELQSYQRQTAEKERMSLPPIDQPAKLAPPAPALPLPGSDSPPSVVVPLISPVSAPSIGS